MQQILNGNQLRHKRESGSAKETLGCRKGSRVRHVDNGNEDIGQHHNEQKGTQHKQKGGERVESKLGKLKVLEKEPVHGKVGVGTAAVAKGIVGGDFGRVESANVHEGTARRTTNPQRCAVDASSNNLVQFAVQHLFAQHIVLVG